MTKIIREENENLPKILKKWAPILELSFGDDLNDNLRKEVSLYCEEISMESTTTTGGNGMGPVSITTPIQSGQPDVINLLPSSMRVLSKINLDGKNIFTMGGPRADVLTGGNETKMISVDCIERKININFDDLNIRPNDPYFNIAIGALVSTNSTPSSNFLPEPFYDLIIEDLVNYINSQLKYYDTMAIYRVIDSISLINENGVSGSILLRSRILFLDRNDETPPMYIVDTDENGCVISCEKSENLSDDFVKATTDDGKSYWVDQSGEEDKIVNNIFSEKEVNDMIDLYEKNINILQSSITILKNSIV